MIIIVIVIVIVIVVIIVKVKVIVLVHYSKKPSRRPSSPSAEPARSGGAARPPTPRPA